MRKYNGISILGFLVGITIFCGSASGQSPENRAAALLKLEGFEEIRVLQLDSLVVCTIERGLSRSPDADYRRALAVLQGVYQTGSPFQIIMLEQGQAVYSLKVAGKDQLPVQAERAGTSKLQPEGEITWADLGFYKSIKKEAPLRRVRSGVTLVVYPQITLQNMYFDKIYEKQFNLAPALHYSGWQGMLLTGQVVFPIVNDLGDRYDYIRPGFLTFSQSIHFPGLNWLKFTAGNFNNDRYGMDLKWKKHFQNSSWSLGANIGYTGRSIYYDQYWNHTSLSTFTWNVKGSYWLPLYQVRADLLVGQFLAGDTGVRMDLSRHFGEVTIGLYAAYTGHNPNGGFHFAFPLDPFKRNHSHQVRIMLPSYYDMEYQAANEFVYDRYYETCPNENRSEQDLYPQFINKQFINPKNRK